MKNMKTLAVISMILAGFLLFGCAILIIDNDMDLYTFIGMLFYLYFGYFAIKVFNNTK